VEAKGGTSGHALPSPRVYTLHSGDPFVAHRSSRIARHASLVAHRSSRIACHALLVAGHASHVTHPSLIDILRVFNLSLNLCCSPSTSSYQRTGTGGGALGALKQAFSIKTPGWKKINMFSSDEPAQGNRCFFCHQMISSHQIPGACLGCAPCWSAPTNTVGCAPCWSVPTNTVPWLCSVLVRTHQHRALAVLRVGPYPPTPCLGCAPCWSVPTNIVPLVRLACVRGRPLRLH
jgi:hypothetical protein